VTKTTSQIRIETTFKGCPNLAPNRCHRSITTSRTTITKKWSSSNQSSYLSHCLDLTDALTQKRFVAKRSRCNCHGRGGL